jgi:uncharacterized SAM-binding protein YcdF (DUF218 family)
MAHIDAVVALGGDFSPTYGIGENTEARMDTALDLLRLGLTKNLIVTGSHAFRHAAPPRPLAHIMAEYAVINDVEPENVRIADTSLETVGDALLTKEVTEDEGWRNLAVVTNEFHLPRSLKIFRHVMGPHYSVSGFAAPNKSYAHQNLHRVAAGALTWLILAGTKPGDDEAIRRRLFTIIPAYKTTTLRTQTDLG